MQNSHRLKQYPYIILLAKSNANGTLLKLGSEMSERFVIGFTRKEDAHIDGYFDRKKWVVCTKFQATIIIHFFRNSLFSPSMNTKILA